MRKSTILFVLGLALLFAGRAQATAIVQTTDYISFPVVALDSATGVPMVPESVHVHVWRGSLTNATVYSNREAEAGADPAQIDSVDYAGATPPQYYFHDQVQDIDGDGTAGTYTINVRMWRGYTPTDNWYTFQIADSSFNTMLTRIGDVNEAALAIKDKSDSLNFQGNDRGTGLAVSVERIAGDSVTAANFEGAYDGDTTWGTNPILSLSHLFVNASGDAVNIIGAQYGINVVSDAKEALRLASVSGGGMIAAGDDYGIRASGTNWYGIWAEGDSAGICAAGSELDDVVLAGTGHMRGWADSVQYITNVSEQVTAVQAYLGAGDGWRQHLFGFGEANKDSIRTFDGGTCVSTIYLWKNDSEPTVLDSITQEIW